jgi:hypothetical protein
MSTYAWLITKDHLTDPDHDTDDAGTYGPSGTTFTREQIRTHPLALEFRMFDDDGELYYTGLCIASTDESLFCPLDDFGTPNAGCTRIDYRNEAGDWEAL